MRDQIRAWVESTRPANWYGLCAGLTDRVVAAFTGGQLVMVAVITRMKVG